jgi:SNF2 family DNA or RNA helicase
VLTTYDMVIQDSSVFRPFHWDLLVVDEGATTDRMARPRALLSLTCLFFL